MPKGLIVKYIQIGNRGMIMLKNISSIQPLAVM
jgi:hypothetical protein